MNNVKRILVLSVIALVGVLGMSTVAVADYGNIINEKSKSIVPISFTVEMTVTRQGGQSNTSQMNGDVNGILVDNQGTVLVSARQLKGPAMFQQGNQRFSIDAVPKNFEARMPDGSMLDAELKTKDSDLDLGFIKIKESLPETPKLTPLSLDESDGSISTGQEVVLLSRFQQSLNYRPQILSTRISAKIEEPRTRYALMDVMDVMSGFIGAPVFSKKGTFLGMMTFRPDQQSIGGGQRRGGNPFSQMSKNRQFILPASEIKNALKNVSNSN